MNHEIEYIQFGISSEEEIIAKSVAKISESKCFGVNSVYDLRLGTISEKELCSSCKQDLKKCPGHSGHISLNKPVIHPMFTRIVVNILKTLCIKCFRVVLSYEHLILEGILKTKGSHSSFDKIVEKLEKVDSCFYCKSQKAKINLKQKTQDIVATLKNKKFILKDEYIKKIFDNIKDEDVALLGFNIKHMHPKNLIITTLEVIPPRARPYIISDGGVHNDDLTISLIEIIKENKKLETFNESDPRYLKAYKSLKFRLKTMMNNSQGKAKNAAGKPLKCIKQRLSGKQGLLRKNLLGRLLLKTGRC